MSYTVGLERYPTVRGRCPACDRTTLFVGDGGYLTCSWVACPNPDAPTDLLESRSATKLPQRMADHLGIGDR